MVIEANNGAVLVAVFLSLAVSAIAYAIPEAIGRWRRPGASEEPDDPDDDPPDGFDERLTACEDSLDGMQNNHTRTVQAIQGLDERMRDLEKDLGAMTAKLEARKR